MRRLSSVLISLSVLLLPIGVSAEEVIRNFSVNATLGADRNLNVTEQIIYDFGELEKHGIFRIIPTTYLRGSAKYNLQLRNIKVKQDNVEATSAVSEEGGRVKIKIGESNKTVTGRHVYEISYTTDRAINFFEDHSELYWNVTGDQWEVPIEKSDFNLDIASLSLPIQPEVQCYTGTYGSIENACEISASSKSVEVRADRLLYSYEGMTAVIGFPLGALKAPTWLEKIGMIVRDNLVLMIPLLALIIMHSLWRARGRDPKLGTVIPIYESPEGLKPGELAAINEDGALPAKGVTAMIIDLARRGYLHIKYSEEAGFISKKQVFTLVKVKSDDSGLSADEKTIFNGLFDGDAEVGIKDLQAKKFYTDIKKAREEIWEKLEAKKIFDKRPATVRAKYFIIGGAIAFILFFFAGSLPLILPTAAVTFLIIAGYGWFMPRRTLKGVRLLADIKGFEWFMNVTEKERLAFHNAPERTPEQFQALLPFAIALGVEQAWAKQFAGMEMEKPDWAEGTGWRMMNMGAFVSNLESLHSQASASGYSAPSSAGSGGSGFSGGGSGGGFGGGGGGSW